jgi:hypothetical protein
MRARRKPLVDRTLEPRDPALTEDERFGEQFLAPQPEDGRRTQPHLRADLSGKEKSVGLTVALDLVADLLGQNVFVVWFPFHGPSPRLR